MRVPNAKLMEGMFVAQVVDESMEPGRFAEVVLAHQLRPHPGSASVTEISQSSRHAPP